MKRFAPLSILIAASLPLVALGSRTWFVDARIGSNGFFGLSSGAPKRTIQAAVNAASDNGATKQGDDQPWTPAIIVKGGNSGFYRIKVGK